MLEEDDLGALAGFLDLPPDELLPFKKSRRAETWDTDTDPAFINLLKKLETLLAKLLAVRDEINNKMYFDRMRRAARRERMTK